MSLESLLPLGGVKNFKSEGYEGKEIDTFQNRWNRHFHTLYGYSAIQNELPFFQYPVDKVRENPYWAASKGIHDEGGNYLGVLDIANPFEWLSMLAIAAKLAMSLASEGMLNEAESLYRAVDSKAGQQVSSQSQDDDLLGEERQQESESNSATVQMVGGRLLQAVAFLFDMLIRFPLGVAATLTCHAFDFIKAVAAFVVATVSATVSQVAAEIGFATGLADEVDKLFDKQESRASSMTL